MRNIFLKKIVHKMWWRNTPRAFPKKLKLSVSLWIMQFVFIECQVVDYRNILKLSCRPLTLTSNKAFKNNKQGPETSLPSLFSFLLSFFIDQISLFGCLYFLRYWAICVL